jgi:hypothetical protein
MTISSTGKAISPRQKHTKLKGENTVEVENHQGQSLSADHVEQGTELPVQAEHGKLIVAGARPIGSSDLQVAETVSISGIRPISTSSFEIVQTINEAGIRPIGANTIHIVGTMHSSGDRPISSSSLVISENYSVMGNRPVASNFIDDYEGLMGFLD